MWFTNVIKPTHRCNLRCRYCYNDDVRQPIMTLGTMRRVVAETIAYASTLGRQVNVDFIWHGGEPMTVGIDFYRAAMEAQRAVPDGLRCANSIQTNGTLLDKEWVSFFKENDFDVSLSIDGPEHINDRTRVDSKDRSSYGQVMQGIKLLRAAGIPHGVCVVISRANKDNTDEIFEFLAREKLCFNVIPLTLSGRAFDAFDKIGLAAGEYAEAWIRLYDRWFYSQDDAYVQCTDFVRKSRAILIGRPTDCIGQRQCATHHISTDPEGYVYPCATLSNDRGMSYGCITEAPLAELVKSDLAFEAMRRATDPQCGTCQWRPVCHGGCMARALKFFGTYHSRDYYCESLRKIYSHIEQRLHEAGLLDDGRIAPAHAGSLQPRESIKARGLLSEGLN